jgi:DNA processing protein
VAARLLLDGLPGVGLKRTLRLLEAFGSARAALAAPAKRFDGVAGTHAAQHRRSPELVGGVDRAVATARRLGMHVCLHGAAGYPERLLNLADPPPVLFSRGRLDLLTAGGVAIVGSRRATQRGRDVARRLGHALAARGVNVVSGLALGVDGAAHEGALEAGGPTVAVMGRGADLAYPRGHSRIFREILTHGLVVSEFAPLAPPLPHHFPRRNRILAALADTLVVVEAAARSGALITVEHGLDLGLDVWAVPGPIDVPSCGGSNALLSDGARALASVEGFVEEVAGGVQTARAVRLPAGVEGALLQELDTHPLEAGVLATRAGVAVPQALAALSSLEVSGWVEQLPGFRFRRAG